MSDDNVTLSPATDAQILDFLRWAIAEEDELKTALTNAEYGSKEWRELLNDYRIVVKRVATLMRAVSKGRVSGTKQ